MKKRFYSLSLACLCLGSLFATEKAEVVVDINQPGSQISRHIYGHFAEHLGRCIYGGIWVGEDSPIPNTKGYRNDIIKAIQHIQIPNLRWPGEIGRASCRERV